MNELNTLETRLNNLLEQDEAINVEASEKGLEELRKNIEAYDSIKDAAWNYDEAHPEKTSAEKAIIDRITDNVYEKVNELNRVLAAKEAQYLEDGREVISIRRQIRELDRRIDKNQSIVSVERGPGLENSESFMKLISDSENELKEDTAKREELKVRMAELTRNMRNLKYGGDVYIRSVAEDEKRRAEMDAANVPAAPTNLPPELDTPGEPKPDDDLDLPPIPGVLPPEPDAGAPTDLPPDLEPNGTPAPADDTALPPDLDGNPVPVPVPVGTGDDNGAGTSGTDEGDSNGGEDERDEEREEEEEDEVIAVANPKPSLWKKVGAVLKKAVLYLAAVITAVSTLGTAYHTAHTDSDIHDIGNTLSGMSDTLTEMGEEDDLDIDGDELDETDDIGDTLKGGGVLPQKPTPTPAATNTPKPSDTKPAPTDDNKTPSNEDNKTPTTDDDKKPSDDNTHKPSTDDTRTDDNTIVGKVGEKEVIEKVSTGENINSDGEVFDKNGNILGDSDLNKDNNGSSLVTGGDFTPDHPATAPANDTEPTYEGWNDPSKSDQENQNIDDAFDNAFNPGTTATYDATDINEVENFDNFWSSFSNDVIGNAQTNQETNGQTLNRSM